MSNISFEELRQYSKQLFDQERATMYGADGEPGLSAYDIAVREGFVGTKQEWLDSLKGTDGTSGKSAYELAVDNGFVGTEQEFLDQLVASDSEFSGVADANLDFLSIPGKKVYDDSGTSLSQQDWYSQFTAETFTEASIVPDVLMYLDMSGYMYNDLEELIEAINTNTINEFYLVDAISMAGGPYVSNLEEALDALVVREINQIAVNAYNASGYEGTIQEWFSSLKNRLRASIDSQMSVSGDILYTSQTPPLNNSFVKCDGSILSQSEYPALFNKIGLIDNGLDFSRGNVDSSLPNDDVQWTGIQNCPDNPSNYVILSQGSTDTIRIYNISPTNQRTLLASSGTNIGSVTSFDISSTGVLYFVSGNQFGMIDISESALAGYSGTLPSVNLTTLPGTGYHVRVGNNGQYVAFYKKGTQDSDPSIVAYYNNDFTSPSNTTSIDDDIKDIMITGQSLYQRLVILTPDKIYNYQLGDNTITRATNIESFGNIKALSKSPTGNYHLLFITDNFTIIDCQPSTPEIGIVELSYCNHIVYDCSARITPDKRYLILQRIDRSGTLFLNLQTLEIVNQDWMYGLDIHAPILVDSRAIVLHRSADVVPNATKYALYYVPRYTYNTSNSFALPVEITKTLNGESVYNYIKLEDDEV